MIAHRDEEPCPQRELPRDLLARRDRFATLIMDSLRKSEIAYSNGVIPRAEATSMISRSISHGIASLRLPPAQRHESLDWPREVGRRRCRQGVPIRSLLCAYHVGGQVVTGAVTQWAAEREWEPARTASLVADMWSVVDEHSNAAVSALRRSADGDPEAAGRLLDALLNGETSSALVAAVASGFGLPERERYAVVVRRVVAGSGRPVRSEPPPGPHSVRIVWRTQGPSAIGVAVLRDRAVTALRDALGERADVRAGISLVVDRLADVGRARELAELAVHATPNGGVTNLADRLPAALLGVRPDLARELESLVLAPVLALEPTSRRVLLDTLAEWMAADGSVNDAARMLDCHRNTVHNRLRRVERLTGRSLSSPRDLTEITLALEAFCLGHGTHG